MSRQPTDEAFLHRLALVARQRYGRIFLLTGLVLAACLFFARNVEFDTEVLNLLPQDDPVIRTFRQTLDDFGSLDVLLVVVRIPPDAVVDPYEDYADELGRSLAELEELEYIDYSIGEIEDLVESFFPKALLFLNEEGRRNFEAGLSDEGIRRRVQELRRQLNTPQSLALKQLMLLDPLGLSELFMDRLARNRGAINVDWTRSYFLSRDHRLLLLIAKPVQPAQEIRFARQLVSRVEEVVEQVEKRWQTIAGPELSDPPEVALGGSYMTALDDASYVRRDLVTNAVTAMVGVLVLFLFAFRRLSLLLYAFVPLSCGLILAFAFATLAFGGLNAATSGFAALLVGLGIDFVIVSYGRYVEERRAGAGLEVALKRMSGSCGRAVLTGGVTTAATFYAFSLTEFTGLREMGFLIGTGILLCMMAVLVLLPAMLAWSEDHHVKREREQTLFLHGFGTAGVIGFSLRHPRLVLALGALVTAVSGLGALRLEFVDSIRTMRPEGNRGIQVQQEVARHFGSGFDYMMLVISGESESEVLSRTSLAAEGAERLVAVGELNGVDSITSMIPPPERQSEALSWLQEHRPGLLKQDRIHATFAAAVESEGMRLDPFEHGLGLLGRAVGEENGLQVADFAHNEQTRRLLERYLRQTPGGWRSVVYLYPPPGVWKREAPPGVERLVEELGPEVVLTGVNVVSETVRRTVKRDAIVAASVGFVLVGFLLWLDYRRLSDTLLSLAPLVVGIVWMLGGMSLLSLHMNFFNIFVSTMIIGIGVDYGIHIMHRHREASSYSPERRDRGLKETGKAIVLAALSTMLGFGSMSLSHYPGLRSMGLVAILGAASTALVAVTLLPAFLSLRGKAPRAAQEPSD